MRNWDTQEKEAACVCRGWDSIQSSSFMAALPVSELISTDGLRLKQVNVKVFCILGARSVSAQ